MLILFYVWTPLTPSRHFWNGNVASRAEVKVTCQWRENVVLDEDWQLSADSRAVCGLQDVDEHWCSIGGPTLIPHCNLYKQIWVVLANQVWACLSKEGNNQSTVQLGHVSAEISTVTALEGRWFIILGCWERRYWRAGACMRAFK